MYIIYLIFFQRQLVLYSKKIEIFHVLLEESLLFDTYETLRNSKNFNESLYKFLCWILGTMLLGT